MLPDRSLTILVAALGGEGGGVMADWLVDAAAHCEYPAQSTSIPGVAQRTGATTYYLEIYPVRREQLGGREPVMSLTPNPGNVDFMVASELIEAARAMQNGYVSPDRTTLIASTHRIYATGEKTHTADGRFDSQRVLDAARDLAKQAVLFDMQRVAQDNGTVINAVLFGALAGCGALPLPREACEQAILRSGKGAEASLSGFAAAYEIASGTRPAPGGTPSPAARPEQAKKPGSSRLHARIQSEFPRAVQEVLALGVARLINYQDEAYATLYLDRVRSIVECDEEPFRVAIETGRHLALWMSYEDVIRVADLKTRPARFARVRRETGAKLHEPVVVVDYLKPGIEEFASIMPAWLGWRLMAWAKEKGKLDTYHAGMRIKTSSILGWLLMRPLAWLKRWRPQTYRFEVEQRVIERWLRAVRAAAQRDAGVALEVVECAGLVKGYGDTHRRGMANFLAILDTLVDKPPSADPREQTVAIRKAREAALADPDGQRQPPKPSIKPQMNTDKHG
jgi:indolepyruvate ferredoxin oxidoreductase beta subunit